MQRNNPLGAGRLCWLHLATEVTGSYSAPAVNQMEDKYCRWFLRELSGKAARRC